jgi:hypothetical protein
MTDWVNRDSTHLGVDRIFTSPTAFALYDNIAAAFEKAAGAPVLANGYVVNAMLADGATVTYAKMASAAIGQAMLKTTTGEVSTAVGGELTLPGGTYGFYPQTKNSSAVTDMSVHMVTLGHSISASYVTRISISVGTGTGFALQRYLQASAPWNLGDGDVPLFVFAAIDGVGKIVHLWIAADPPWGYNGPTSLVWDVREFATGKNFRLVPRTQMTLAEAKRSPALMRDYLDEHTAARVANEFTLVEITQAMKQADMPLIPHPFQGTDLTGLTVVMMDPMSPLGEKIEHLRDSGEMLADELFRGDYLRFGNTGLSRAAPPGVMPVDVRWRLT